MLCLKAAADKLQIGARVCCKSWAVVHSVSQASDETDKLTLAGNLTCHGTVSLAA